MKLRNPEIADIRRRAFRTVRRSRGLSAAEAARAMGLPRRTYQYFEGGEARLDLRRLEQFSDALDVDGHALLLAMMLDRPHFAVRAGHSQLVAVALGLCADLDLHLGEDVARLDGPTVMRVLKPAFESLAEEALARTFKSGPTRRG